MDKSNKPRFFTGIQATGALTLGNYLGLIRHIRLIQEEYEIIIMIADLHSLTIPNKDLNYREKCYEIASLLYACGLKKENCKIFIQSEIKEHLELAWLLAPFVTISELINMIQYKEKKKEQETGSLTLLSYPVLMAADIFLYDASFVIVGQDQKQHLELTSNIARKFNNFYRHNLLNFPSFEIPLGGKIMSLKNPQKKMSKSESEKNFIGLLDSDETIERKVLDAVTDPYFTIRFEPESQPGISNLLTIYALLKDKKIEEAEADFRDYNVSSDYLRLKVIVSELIKEEVRKIREGYRYIQEIEIKELIEKNNGEIRKLAEKKMREIKEKLKLKKY